MDDNHFSKHILPFKDFLLEEWGAGLVKKFNIFGYYNEKYGGGHTALKLEDAVEYFNVVRI